MVQIGNYARDVETGVPFVTGNATIKGPDGATLATPALNGTTGRWAYEANGQPGKTQQTYVAAGQTKIIEGDAYGQAGDWCESELSRILKLFGDGVIDGMAVTAPGGMAVQVGTGNALNLGVLHPIYTAENVTIGAAHASLTRIDRVVSRLTRTGTFAGKVVLAVVAGTPSGSPAVPALTNDANTWEVEIARVTVPGAASSIVLGNISTATRSIATGPVADGSVTSAKIADGTIQLGDLAAAPFILPGLIANTWYSARQVYGGDLTPASMAADRLQCVPIFIPKATTLTEMGVYRAGGTTASATARLGLYTSTSEGIPGTLVLDAGTVSVSTTGAKTITGLSQALSAGWYWAAVCAGSWTGTLTLTGFDSASGIYRPVHGDATGPFTSEVDYLGLIGTFVGTGSLPASFPSVSALTSAPNVWIKTSGT